METNGDLSNLHTFHVKQQHGVNKADVHSWCGDWVL